MLNGYSIFVLNESQLVMSDDIMLTAIHEQYVKGHVRLSLSQVNELKFEKVIFHHHFSQQVCWLLNSSNGLSGRDVLGQRSFITGVLIFVFCVSDNGES